jgi:hypothetical protein
MLDGTAEKLGNRAKKARSRTAGWGALAEKAPTLEPDLLPMIVSYLACCRPLSGVDDSYERLTSKRIIG